MENMWYCSLPKCWRWWRSVSWTAPQSQYLQDLVQLPWSQYHDECIHVHVIHGSNMFQHQNHPKSRFQANSSLGLGWCWCHFLFGLFTLYLPSWLAGRATVETSFLRVWDPRNEVLSPMWERTCLAFKMSEIVWNGHRWIEKSIHVAFRVNNSSNFVPSAGFWYVVRHPNSTSNQAHLKLHGFRRHSLK